MATRTTYDEVIAILDNCGLDQPTIEGVIKTANLMMNAVFGTGESDLLTEIEKYLAAHIVAYTLHRQTSQEALGDGKQVFTGKWGEGLSATSYGQIALALDTTGKLGKAGKNVIQMIAIQTEYLTF